MRKEDFNKRKENLLQFVKEMSNKSDLNNTDKTSLNKLIHIVGEYNFENRLEIKGLISRTIIDSLELDYSIGEKFIEFDNSIR